VSEVEPLEVEPKPVAGVRRVAVVLFNLGGPDSLKAVRPFLFNLFNDPAIFGLPQPARAAAATAISSLRASGARKNYEAMGGSSPLLRETRAQARELGARFSESEVDARVFIAMRYWRPMTGAATKAVAGFEPDDVVLLPLYPQFSASTTASSLKAWTEAYKGPGKVHAVCCYPDDPGLVEAHARLIEKTWEEAGRPSNVKILFSAHGLPEKAVAAGDPYQWQIERTAAAVVARLAQGPCRDLPWQVCYQSRVGPLKWLGPYTPEAIEAAAHDGLGVLVSPIAFVSEHVETLIELDRDYAEVAEHAGAPLYLRVPALGVEPAFVDGLAGLVAKALTRSEGVESGCGGRICPEAFGRCPVKQGASVPLLEEAAP
jgi:ferrochelatase